MAILIIQMVANMHYSDAGSILRKQLIRSATSVAANFRAVTRARSNKEQYAKLCVVVEEVDETLFWIELITECGHLDINVTKEIYQEALEILKVMSAYKKKLSPKN